MTHRFSGGARPFVFVFLLLLPVMLSAQVYPRTAELDVITLTDGTVLKGIITESVAERFVQIEVYGGSTFVLGFDQILSIERLPNPDYSPNWIKIDLAELQPQADEGRDIVEPTNTTETVTEQKFGDVRSLREGGIVLGISITLSAGSFTGPDWEDFVPDDIEGGDTFVRPGLEAVFRVTGQPEVVSGTPFTWGIRAGIGFITRDGGFYQSDPFGAGDLEYREWTDTLRMPLEILVGGAGERFALYGGVGPGLSLLMGDYEYEFNYKGSGDFDIYDSHETDTDVTPIFIASLNGVFRLGRNWEGDVRLAFERQLIPWVFDREVYHQAVDLTLGIGYRF